MHGQLPKLLFLLSKIDSRLGEKLSIIKIMVFKFRLKGLLGLATLFLLISCADQQAELQEGDEVQIELDSAEWIINQSIEYHGGDFQGKLIEFDFRDIYYKASFLEQANYMTRTSFKGDSVIVDSTSGENALRTINNLEVELTDKKSKAISNSINSVFYFALLPSKLADPAVIAGYKGIVKTKAGDFYQVSVQFKQEGGGEDFQDKFFYWFNAETFQLSFLAYSYETSGGGMRFRAVEKQNELKNGYVFQDYVNYKTDSLATDLQDLLPLQLDSGLLELSTIRLENLVVR